MTRTSYPAPGTSVAAATECSSPALSPFCESVFSSFARRDQRQWGEVYVRGLLEVRGRKSISRISTHVLGRRADQSLQQFVNQSSWEWQAVRRELAEQVVALLRPRAWVVDEAVLPKSGRNSVAVERQFSQTAGRVLNCQLGLTVLLAGPAGCVPVNWRLLLPRSWDKDTERRARAGLPDHLVHRSRWEDLFDSLDEMVRGWGLPALPVVVDAAGDPTAHRLIHGLEERGLRYVVRADSATEVGRSAQGRPITAAQCLSLGTESGGARIRARGDFPRPTRFLVTSPPLRPTASPGDRRQPEGVRRGDGRPRKVVAEWVPSATPGRRHSVWITNLETRRPTDVFEAIALRRRAHQELERLSEECGLRHFEGRSFRGWHHHTTLVSVASAFLRLTHGAGNPGPPV
ncbi:IS701 family transposase [Streptomyces sp. NPDC050759]|uniref:IS701 family transposase n=1 Tax=Streptomyces sp. NPDC050759 TaxID=3365635 RepID=UPI0037B11137